MLQWFYRLMPRQEMFFPLFQRHADVIVAGAKSLHHMLEGGDKLEAYCRDLLEQEHRADEIAREVLLGVRTTFITPFDRAASRTPRRGLCPVRPLFYARERVDRSPSCALRPAQSPTEVLFPRRTLFWRQHSRSGWQRQSQGIVLSDP